MIKASFFNEYESVAGDIVGIFDSLRSEPEFFCSVFSAILGRDYEGVSEVFMLDSMNSGGDKLVFSVF